uniref:probable G-protein coupled receptor 146 n=1 Tax=Myxine glutinosa TaxID=7769 RepID=UPI00358F7384
MWSCSQLIFFPPVNSCAIALWIGSGASKVIDTRTCGITFGTNCKAEEVLSGTCLVFLILLFPMGLFYNLSIMVVNLVKHTAMAALDVYFVSLVFANLLQLLAATGGHLWSRILPLLQPTSAVALPTDVQPLMPCLVIFVIFSVSALAGACSLALLSLDASLTQALPRNPMVSAHNARQLCAFIWGGAVLAAFPIFLLFACRTESYCRTMTEQHDDGLLDCRRLQVRPLADAVTFFAGFAVPLLGVAISVVLSCHTRRRALAPPGQPQMDEDTGEVATTRLVHFTVLAYFVLWAPYHGLLLTRLVGLQQVTAGPKEHILAESTMLLTYVASCIIPILYKHMHSDFGWKVRETLNGLPCWQARHFRRHNAATLHEPVDV